MVQPELESFYKSKFDHKWSVKLVLKVPSFTPCIAQDEEYIPQVDEGVLIKNLSLRSMLRKSHKRKGNFLCSDSKMI